MLSPNGIVAIGIAIGLAVSHSYVAAKAYNYGNENGTYATEYRKLKAANDKRNAELAKQAQEDAERAARETQIINESDEALAAHGENLSKCPMSEGQAAALSVSVEAANKLVGHGP